MATSLADSAPATIDAPAESAGAPGSPTDPSAGASSPVTARSCANCGAPMSPGQDWCLQCGAGAPGGLGDGAPSWRSGAGILIATAILALGAAAAAYAALNKSNGRTVGVTRTVAAVTVPPAATPGSTPVPTPAVPKGLTTPTVKPLTPLTSATQPKIPLTATTPKVATPTTPASTTPAGSGTTPAGSGSGEAQPQAILLDTNAASTYNPYVYPASSFGDPSLAIDGETSTGWSAQVDPAVAPKMAEGLAIDLKSARKLTAVELITSTPGMTVQVYGTTSAKLPASITDPAWAKLSVSVPVRARHTRIKLKPGKAVRFVTLWISKAPASSVGTPQAPGRVTVNELELFP